MVFNMTGNGDGLNFAVKQYTTTPTGTAAENTIGIVTDTAITSYSMESEQPLLRSGNKNLQVYPFYSSTISMNGLNFTDNADGSVSVSGTATANTYYFFSHITKAGAQILLPKGTYTLSGCPKGGSASKYSVGCNEVDGDKKLARDYGNGATFTIEKDTAVFVYFVVFSGTTLNGIVIRPQLEKGSSVTSFVKGDATGQVWIEVAAASDVAFFADKKQRVKVYPKSVKQYVDGAWANKEAYVYQNDAWVLFSQIIVYYYDKGTYLIEFRKGLNATDSDGYITVGKTNGGNGYLCSSAINLDSIETLYIAYGAADIGGGTLFGIDSTGSVSTGTIDKASVSLTATGSLTTQNVMSVDVSSLTGTGYIKLYVNNEGYKNGVINVFEVYAK